MNKNQDLQSTVATIILAAGGSRRMGQPKQLLPYRGQTLLSHVAQCALASPCSPVLVILGANAAKIEPQIAHIPLKLLKNNYWKEGISSSIRYGITYIQEQCLNIDAVVFLTCDQPYISAELIEELIAAYQLTNKPIIASQYGETLGIPALFERTFFSALMQLQGDRGAKKIIKQYPDLVDILSFPRGKFDLDTFENYQQLVSSHNLSL